MTRRAAARGASRPGASLGTAVVALAVAVAVIAGGCSSEDRAGTGRSSTIPTTTITPTPSTVSDSDFDSQATTAELMVRNAGTDPCAVIKAFAPASSLPTPVNPTQTERGVKVIAELFTAAADAAPDASAADAAVLRQAATDLVAEGAANRWQPGWLMGTPKTIADAKVAQAFANYQSAVSKTCATTP